MNFTCFNSGIKLMSLKAPRLCWLVLETFEWFGDQSQEMEKLIPFLKKNVFLSHKYGLYLKITGGVQNYRTTKQDLRIHHWQCLLNQLSPDTNFMIEVSKIVFHHVKKPCGLVELLSFVWLVPFFSLLLLVEEDSFFVSSLIGP